MNTQNRVKVAQELIRLAKSLVAEVELPTPEGIPEAAWQKWKESLWPRVQKAIERAGITIEKIDPKEAFYEYFHLRWKDIDFKIGASSVDDAVGVSAFESFARNISDALNIAKEMEKSAKESGFSQPDVFHSSIYEHVRDVFKSKEGRHLAYQFIAEYLRKNGVRVSS